MGSRGWTALTEQLTASDDRSTTLSFAQIEAILGRPLPRSAHVHPAFWSNSVKNAYSRHWRSAGFRVTRAGLAADQIRFERVAPSPTATAPRTDPTRTGRKGWTRLRRGSGDTTSTTGDRVVLLGCVSQKAPTACVASELYISPLWQRRRRYAEESGHPWLILSAEYGVVAPDDVIQPYDRSLKDAGVRERRAWSSQVAEGLIGRLGGVEGVTFEIHAGAAYIESLAPLLTAAGARVERPLDGLKIGEQLHWYDQH